MSAPNDESSATGIVLRGSRIGPRSSRRPEGILDRAGRIGLGSSPPAVAIATIVRVRVPHAVNDRPEDRDSRAVELASGALDLGEPAGVVADGQHRAVDPSA